MKHFNYTPRKKSAERDKKLEKTFLIIDTETGGINPEKHSLLEIAGCAWYPGEEPEELFSFYVREPSLVVDEKALEVNKINLNKVIEEGLTPNIACRKIYNTVRPYWMKSTEVVKPTMICHSSWFDWQFLKRLHIMGDFPLEHINDRIIDTRSIMKFLQLSSFPDLKSSSFDRMLELAEIQIKESERHTALGDAMALGRAMNRILEKLNGN